MINKMNIPLKTAEIEAKKNGMLKEVSCWMKAQIQMIHLLQAGLKDVKYHKLKENKEHTKVKQTQALQAREISDL
jgi:hypothetical protein